MKTISIVNMKGGVAKTTLAVTIADCLVRRHDLKVLLIDIDPQFNATQCLLSGDDYVQKCKEGQHTIVHLFEDAPRPSVASVNGAKMLKPVKIEDITPWKIKNNFHLIPGALELYRLDMAGGQGREQRLRRFISYLKENEKYDIVIIDTPPTPSAWMASALLASDFFIVPVKPEPLSATGIDLLRVVVDRVKENYGLDLKCIGVVLTIAEENTIVYRKAKDFIDNNEYWKGKRFRYSLPKRTEIARMQDDQKLILDSSDSKLKHALVSITRELLDKIDLKGN